jgi:hypothetical protein
VEIEDRNPPGILCKALTTRVLRALRFPQGGDLAASGFISPMRPSQQAAFCEIAHKRHRLAFMPKHTRWLARLFGFRK